MALPVLRLNLVPAPSLWRRQHELISWGALSLGILGAGLTGFLIWNAHHQASLEAGRAVSLSHEADKVQRAQTRLQGELAEIQLEKELPRWKLAERVLTERGTPWSRIISELERSQVQDTRVKSLIKITGRDGTMLKLKGESRTRQAEVALIESFKANAFFRPAILERESERQGGGIEFDLTLPVSDTLPTWTTLPLHGPVPKAAAQPAVPVKPAAAKPVPVKPQPVAAVQAPKPMAPAAAQPQAPRPITVGRAPEAPALFRRDGTPAIPREGRPPQEGLRREDRR